MTLRKCEGRPGVTMTLDLLLCVTKVHQETKRVFCHVVKLECFWEHVSALCLCDRVNDWLMRRKGCFGSQRCQLIAGSPVTLGSWQGRPSWQERVMEGAAHLLVSREHRKIARGSITFKGTSSVTFLLQIPPPDGLTTSQYCQDLAPKPVLQNS